jgi:hypothetical protein
MADLLKSGNTRPCPIRAADPDDERRPVIMTQPSACRPSNHFVFGGDLHRARTLARAVVAGAVHGDALIALACQCAPRSMPREVVYIDLSEASREMSRATRAQQCTAWDNVRFETGSFSNPAARAAARSTTSIAAACCTTWKARQRGLRALARLLRPLADGLMLYGVLGRTGV